MSVEQVMTTTPSVANEDKSDVRLTSSSRRAAAIEAAYILEAVRK